MNGFYMIYIFKKMAWLEKCLGFRLVLGLRGTILPPPIMAQ